MTSKIPYMLADKVTFQDHVTRNDPDHVHVVGTMVEMVLILAVMVLFDFFPDRIGMSRSLTDPSSFRPLLAPEFQEHMPWLNLYWGLALSLCALNLSLGRWTLYTRWAEFGLGALAAYIMLRMVLGGPLTVYPVLTMLAKFGLIIALVVSSLDLIAKLMRLLARTQTVTRPEESQQRNA